MKKPQLYHHQQLTVDFLEKTPRAFIGSTAGTGKTLCIVKDVERIISNNLNAKVLILAPKSLLETVWADEFKQWAPHIMTSVATAPEKKRIEAFKTPAQVYITNIDALKWLAKQEPSFFNGYEAVIIDESTSIKNDSQRTKAALQISQYFKYRRCLSGTPTAGPIVDLFYQYYFLDDGNSFGKHYTKFQYTTMNAITKPNMPTRMKTWSNKPGIEPIVAKIVEPITIRFELQQVVDMPPVLHYTHHYNMNAKSKKIYMDMKNYSQAQLDTGTVTALNASTLTNKLLQASAGFMYDTETDTKHLVDTQRYDLVLDLCENAEFSVVFFRWTAQKEYFLDQAKKRGLPVTFIDGSVPVKERTFRVNKFQNGDYRIIFLQPQSTAHGITLTKAEQTIWSCPIYLGDYYSQGNNRVFRLGQDKRTTVINVEAKGTLDHIVYKKLEGKLDAMDTLTEALV